MTFRLRRGHPHVAIALSFAALSALGGVPGPVGPPALAQPPGSAQPVTAETPSARPVPATRAATRHTADRSARAAPARSSTPLADPQLVPLRAEAAWRYSTGAGVTVAVLDSGVDAEHPSLAGRVLPGADEVDGSTDGTSDPVGHGTTVASLIVGRDGETAIGLAPDATILPVRVLDEHNRYQTAATVAAGVVWAVTHGAQIINLSLGSTRRSPSLSAALDLAMAHDVVVVACTGNQFEAGDPGVVWYPARESGVIAVAGLVWNPETGPRPWPASIVGSQTALSAPALLRGARPDGEYATVRGTSFSAALVSATAALIRARWPEMSAGDVVNRLVRTAQDHGPAGRDPRFGFGVLDPVAALTATVPLIHLNPLDTKVRDGRAGFGPAPRRP